MARLVLPMVKALLPCSHVKLLEGQPFVLTNPLHTIWLQRGQTQQRGVTFAIYIQLIRGVGKVPVVVQWLNDTGFVVRRSKPIPLRFHGSQPFHVDEVAFVLKNLPVPRTGVYTLQVYGNYKPLQFTTGINDGTDEGPNNNAKFEIRILEGSDQ